MRISSFGYTVIALTLIAGYAFGGFTGVGVAAVIDIVVLVIM